MQLDRYGVWSLIDSLSAPETARFAQRVEAWGYSTLWVPEAAGREVLATASYLLANTKKLVIGTGIASIYARGAMTSRAGQLTLNEQSGGRFLLGLGVSNRPLVEGLRGMVFGKPIETMRAYLEAMDKATYLRPGPEDTSPRVIGALGPGMLGLARTHADGALTSLVTPEHTARARALLGPDKLLCVEQRVVLETKASVARGAARKAIAIYLLLPYFCNSLKAMGFSDTDFAGHGSDRLIDAIVGWGNEAAITARIKAHLDAGANQVCIQPIQTDGAMRPDERILEALAPNHT